MLRNKDETFGAFVRSKRLAAGLGLREAARAMNMPAAYVSRVESNLDPPSGKLLTDIAVVYRIKLEELNEKAKPGSATAAARGRFVQSNPELRALYRLAIQMEPDRINELLRSFLLDFLREKGATEEEIEKKLAELKLELPRISKGPRDGLFAAAARPRRLTKSRVQQMAHDFLAQHGLTTQEYSPPTQIEMLVELEPVIKYRIDDNLKCRENGEPLVLGLTGFNELGEAQIVINAALADSPNLPIKTVLTLLWHTSFFTPLSTCH